MWEYLQNIYWIVCFATLCIPRIFDSRSLSSFCIFRWYMYGLFVVKNILSASVRKSNLSKKENKIAFLYLRRECWSKWLTFYFFNFLRRHLKILVSDAFISDSGFMMANEKFALCVMRRNIWKYTTIYDSLILPCFWVIYRRSYFTTYVDYVDKVSTAALKLFFAPCTLRTCTIKRNNTTINNIKNNFISNTYNIIIYIHRMSK